MADDGTDPIALLEAVLPEDRIDAAFARRERSAGDESVHAPVVPDAVAHPTSTDEVAAILARANERGIPVTPRAGGSSLEGNPIPVAGGIALDVTGLDRIDVRPTDLQVDVGPGVVYDDLNERLSRDGLRFPPGISSGDVATVGGMIANNASGFNAVRYGVTREHVQRLEVVLPDGRIIECGRRVVKSTAGYSLKDLFVGSEGTLGVITDATLGLAGIPPARRAALVTFPTRRAASRAVAEVMTAGVVPGAIEFMDELTVRMVTEHTDVDLDEAPTLLIELHGNEAAVEADVPFVRRLCEEAGASDWLASDRGHTETLWRARRAVLPAYRAYRGDLEPAVLGDVVVPISRYPDLVAGVEAIAEEAGVLVPTVGHAGDGNLHFCPLVSIDRTAAHERGRDVGDRIAALALDLGGSVSAEHGVGLGKRKFMAAEHGPALDLMRTIKRAVDPNGIMNPGKVLPAEEA